MRKKLVILLFCLTAATLFSQQRIIHLCNGGDQYQFDFNSHPDSTFNYIKLLNPPSNIWQTGFTSKNWFNQGTCGSLRGLMTDTVNVYPTNNSSSFEFYITDCFPYNSNGIRLVMQYWTDCDTLLDGMMIAYSHNGITWTNASSTGGTYSSHTSSVQSLGGQLGLTGKSTGNFDLYFGNYQDTLALRFTFASDAIQTNRGGIRIDWIISEATNPLDVNSYQLHQKNVVYPNPAHDNVSLSLQGPLQVQIKDVCGNTVFSENVPSGNALNVSSLARGIYFLRVTQGANVYTSKFCKE